MSTLIPWLSFSWLWSRRTIGRVIACPLKCARGGLTEKLRPKSLGGVGCTLWWVESVVFSFLLRPNNTSFPDAATEYMSTLRKKVFAFSILFHSSRLLESPSFIVRGVFAFSPSRTVDPFPTVRIVQYHALDTVDYSPRGVISLLDKQGHLGIPSTPNSKLAEVYGRQAQCYRFILSRT
jgi:hypothetical protein